MKDRIVRPGLRGPSDQLPDVSWPRPFASPDPELDGVADELRQLYALYSDDGDVPDALAELAKRAADAYERVGVDDRPEGCGDRLPGDGPADRSGKRH